MEENTNEGQELTFQEVSTMHYSKRFMKPGLLIIFFLLNMMVSVTHAEKYEDPKAAFAAGEFEQALKLYLPLAEQGDVEAQARVGIMYANGMGTKHDHDAALEWLNKAADKGNADAENILGNMYVKGLGVEVDYDTALDWYHKAAIQGHTGALYNIGASYFRGNGVEESYYMSYVWMKLAAKYGHKTAANYAETLESIMSPEELEEARARISELESGFTINK